MYSGGIVKDRSQRSTLCRNVLDLAIVEATPRKARHGMILTIRPKVSRQSIKNKQRRAVTYLVHRLPQLYTKVSLS